MRMMRGMRQRPGDRDAGQLVTCVKASSGPEKQQINRGTGPGRASLSSTRANATPFQQQVVNKSYHHQLRPPLPLPTDRIQLFTRPDGLVQTDLSETEGICRLNEHDEPQPNALDDNNSTRTKIFSHIKPSTDGGDPEASSVRENPVRCSSLVETNICLNTRELSAPLNFSVPVSLAAAVETITTTTTSNSQLSIKSNELVKQGTARPLKLELNGIVDRHASEVKRKVFIDLDDANCRCIVRESATLEVTNNNKESLRSRVKRKHSKNKDRKRIVEQSDEESRLLDSSATTLTQIKCEPVEISLISTPLAETHSDYNIGNQLKDSEPSNSYKMATALTASIEHIVQTPNSIIEDASDSELNDSMTEQQLMSQFTASEIDEDDVLINDKTNHQHQNSLARQLSNSTRQTHAFLPANNTTLPIKLTGLQLDQLTELIKSIREDNLQAFTGLLEKREFKSNLLNVFVDGQTALHYSLMYGRGLAWCKQLVINGANPNLTTRVGWHPIHLAAFSGSRETMRYLIDLIDPA